MKANLIKLEYTINTGNYCNIKVGGEWNVEDGESVKDAMVKARAELQGVVKEFDKIKKEEEKAKAEAIAQKLNQ